jgi:endoglucanase
MSPAPGQLNRRAVIAGLAAAAGAATFPTAAAGPEDRARFLSRGFNLPGWVDTADGIAPSPAVLEALALAGFGAVRLPVNGDRLALGDAADRTTALSQIEAAVKLLNDSGFAVMLDLHSSEGIGSLLESDPVRGEDAAVAAWEAMAPIAAGYAPEAVFPELLNEPPLERRRWMRLRDRLAETVRKHCPDHTLIWGASRVQGIWETTDLPALPDENAIVAVHYYWPMGFTHQCQSWGDSPLARLKALPFPATRKDDAVVALRASLEASGDTDALALLAEEFSTPWATKRIAAEFADLKRYATKTKTPVVINEFGVLNFCVDAQSRTTWVRAVRKEAEKAGFGWTYWELDQGFGFIADRTSVDGFDDTMMAALLA